MAVFPPIDESTCDRRVVGMLYKSIPLIKVLATIPERSPTMPPPIAMRQSVLVKLFSTRVFKIC